MGYKNNWKPSKTAAREFAQEMDRLQAFCDNKGISYSSSMDSYYFSHNGTDYRVSNHAVTNRFNWHYNGVEWVKVYKDTAHKDDTTYYIHASKTRIEEIYNRITSGQPVDGRGNPINK